MKNRIKSFALRHITSLCIGFAIVFMLFVTGGMIRSIRENLDNISRISALTDDTRFSIADIPVISVGENYLIKEYDGRIGVFTLGDTQPIRVIQVYVAYLPERDRCDLKEGIYVNGILRLEKIIEDLRS